MNCIKIWFVGTFEAPFLVYTKAFNAWRGCPLHIASFVADQKVQLTRMISK